MELSLKLFGPEARAVGSSKLLVDLPALPIDCATLRRRLIEMEPRLAKLLPTARFAVNCDFVADDSLIGEGDEVAIINQTSGG